MNAVMALKGLVDESPLSYSDVASALGVSKGAFASMWRQGSVGSGRMARVAALVGYEVALVPKGSKLPKGAIVLEEGL